MANIPAMDVEQLTRELFENPIDPNSFGRVDLVRVAHSHLALKVDFERHILSGRVVLTAQRVCPEANRFNLDTLNLKIFSVVLLQSNGSRENAPYLLHPEVAEFGSKLEVDISGIEEYEFQVEIEYETSSLARGLQWLGPEQTEGQKSPFMFSQNQAINARSMLPCQDTPSVKSTYTADIEAPEALQVVMSAKISNPPTPGTDSQRVHHFRQRVPIQSYLIAIAVGDLSSKRIGAKSHVWAEPGVVEKAAWEFAEVDTILATAEHLAGPYEFDIYDILVLPPSFPYGGMENPCLTFATPTILAGDRSQVYVIAHEISHSWTGNLVTNVNFGHFWLNEGFTTFLERKIEGRMDKNGERMRHLAALEGLKELNSTVAVLGPDSPFTRLVVDIRGVNPDDVFSNVPYEKGHTFLFFLEQQLGGPTKFEPFLRAYIQKFKPKSISTLDFKDFLFEYFSHKSDVLQQIDFDSWFFKPGMPLVIPDYDRTLLNACTELAKRWASAGVAELANFTSVEFDQLGSIQKKLFLMELTELLSANSTDRDLNVEKVKRVTDLYSLAKVANTEVRLAYIELGLALHCKDIVANAVQFVTEFGRMKYTRPVYRRLYAWPETRQLAIDTFRHNQKQMMKMSADSIASILGLKK